MNKIAFIIPYFGKLPAYFEEWAYSAGFLHKQGVDFIVMTDCDIEYSLSSNIKILSMSFDEFKAKIQNKFEFKIALNTPYKICDFRPAFGYVFEDIIKGYDFWGNTDLDQVWGNFKSIITDEILDNHEKILYLGHCSLYRNNKKMNTMFMRKGGMASYKEVFSSDGFYAFDEFAGMVAICKKNDVKTYYDVVYADLAVQTNRITIRKAVNYKKQLVYWSDGHVYRSYIDEDGVVKTDEFLYFHFQKKNPRTLNSMSSKPTAFFVHAKKFQAFSSKEISLDFIETNSDYINDEVDQRDESAYKKNKMNVFMKSNIRDKAIWIRRKLFAKSL